MAPSNSPTESNIPPAVDHPTSWHYPPEFWDRLSKIPLTRSALKELDRRNGARPAFSPPPTSLARDLARFARHGGPDLRGLRGCVAPAKSKRQHTGATNSSSQSKDPSSTAMTSKRSSPYDPGFDQHLTDHGIHTIWKSQKPNLEQTRAALAIRRPSLTPCDFSESAFETFQQTAAQAKDERDVLDDVFPTITGPLRNNYPSTKSMVFGNLEPLTTGTITAPKPDIALGALPEELNPTIRNALQHHIIPSTTTDRLMVPNFFVEAKGPDGSAAVMTRQARYHGAVGARAMHSLQNYGEEEPAYNGKAYTYSSTYHDGQLKLYTHHLTAPTTAGGQPEYHMNQLQAYSLTSNRETFIQGASAYRNLRDLAKNHRDTFIRDANSR
ncbi:hypothetical protein DHEL01_v207901 [Diaporthe helianthi]|uniref:DUF7924 domain-containing protein n=1 Tax=Diaporthe helianthi TaxID=158607 RepID=A0A2P5HU05_DIAHE|nr:hypothetical protein DHEL01_v207901 [Diaporthe helianthi]